MPPPPLAFFLSGSSSTGGGQCGLDGLRSLTLRLSWIVFLLASTLSLPLVSALAGGTAGMTTSAVAHMVSVKSPIADFRMRFSRGIWSKLVCLSDCTYGRSNCYDTLVFTKSGAAIGGPARRSAPAQSGLRCMMLYKLY
jgi:hypothetical protein